MYPRFQRHVQEVGEAHRVKVQSPLVPDLRVHAPLAVASIGPLEQSPPLVLKHLGTVQPDLDEPVAAHGPLGIHLDVIPCPRSCISDELAFVRLSLPEVVATEGELVITQVAQPESCMRKPRRHLPLRDHTRVFAYLIPASVGPEAHGVEVVVSLVKDVLVLHGGHLRAEGIVGAGAVLPAVRIDLEDVSPLSCPIGFYNLQVVQPVGHVVLPIGLLNGRLSIDGVALFRRRVETRIDRACLPKFFHGDMWRRGFDHSSAATASGRSRRWRRGSPPPGVAPPPAVPPAPAVAPPPAARRALRGELAQAPPLQQRRAGDLRTGIGRALAGGARVEAAAALEQRRGEAPEREAEHGGLQPSQGTSAMLVQW
mmetsp:Transcript_89962/g.262952  ORF Transcript_89962/g.262952 Transcript_89962/m.262952 type:complete len:369 (+) Transcript_89962:1417-2523(+)